MKKIEIKCAWVKRFIAIAVFAVLFGCGAIDEKGDREIIFEILSAQLVVLDGQPAQLEINVSGNTTSAGWTEPRLVASEYLTPPADGIYDFTFYATPPEEHGVTVLTPIEVSHHLKPIPVNFKGVRIHSDTNEVLVVHDVQQPPQDPAIINEITGVKLSLLKSLPPKLAIDVKGTVNSAGWSNATLVPHVYIVPPQDGFYEFTYYATPPATPGTTVITSTELTHILDPLPGDLVGVRIFSETNNIETRLVAETPSPQIINEITVVQLSVLESLPRQLDIAVEGTVTGAGWTSPMLVPFQYLVPPQDGIYDYTFFATPPSEPGATVITPIKLTHRLNPLSDNLKGIRVHSQTNEILAELDLPVISPNSTIIDSISDVKVSIVPGGSNQLDIKAKGIVLSAGWSQPVLIAHNYLVPPQDGVYDFTFYATPPDTPSASVLTPIDVVHRLQVPSNLAGVRIHSNTNNMTVLLNDSGQTSLNENMNKWIASGIASYQYTYRRSCFCMPVEDVIVVVNAGTIIDATYTPSGTALNAQELNSIYTVEDLFLLIQQAINNKNSKILEVIYNANNGYPEKISIDWLVGAIDDEMTYFVNAFQ